MRKLFFPYLLADFPSASDFSDILDVTAAYADTIEIGIPFSDPVADGPILQQAAAQVLSNGFQIESLFRLLQDKSYDVAIAMMSYANPVLAYGRNEFLKACRQCRVKFLIVPDVPAEEAHEWKEEAKNVGLTWISFISLLTKPDRLQRIASSAEGFVYLLSLTGITGRNIHGIEAIRQKAFAIRQQTPTPIALGFGIKSPEDTLPFFDRIDAFIVGSRIIELIRADGIPGLQSYYKEFCMVLNRL